MSDSTALTTSERATAMMVGKKINLGGMSFTVAKQVTKTVLPQIDGQPFYIRFETKAYQGEELKTGRGGKQQYAPARLAEVTDLETNQLHLLIMNTVLESELDRSFPDGGYAGKCFAINRAPKANKDGVVDPETRYKVYTILEIVPPEAEQTAHGSDMTSQVEKNAAKSPKK